jgi:imidazolonepropionase
MKLTGPFTQLLTMDNLRHGGKISDSEIEIVYNAGILTENGIISEIGDFSKLQSKVNKQNIKIEKTDVPMVALPGFIDAHTHICWAGSRTNDYALRLSGKSYLEIARSGGGIWSTVLHTRKATW